MNAEDFISENLKETAKHASAIALKIKHLPCLILLSGDLGAGKTTWSKSFISTYLKKDTVVTSPSYSIMNAYRNKTRAVYHFDLYRLRDADDLESVGFWDFLEKKNVVLVEWGDQLPPQWPNDIHLIKVEIKIISETSRKFIISESNL